MSDVHRIPGLNEVEREASEWIARLNASDVTPEDRAGFEAWRSAHLLHARVYEEMSALLAELEHAGPMVRAVSFAQSMNEATTVQSRDSSVRLRRAWRPWAAAALLAAVSIAGALYLKPWASSDLYTTAIGEHATVALPDGSTLELNSNSAASVDFSKNARVIHLKRGEGYFKVTHDARRPFWVVGGGSWIRAVGTAFNVYLRPDDVRVTVSEGTVKVGSEDSLQGSLPSDLALANAPTAVLTAGEQADLHGSATDTRKLSAVEVQRAQTWREGTVYFENQPLGEVVDELSRYTPQRLIIEDVSIRRLPVGGTFETSPQGTESLLTMLEQGFGLTVHREADKVFIEPARDKSPN